jgi:hypothetical protein
VFFLLVASCQLLLLPGVRRGERLSALVAGMRALQLL